MSSTIKRTTLALAVAALFASPAVFASEHTNGRIILPPSDPDGNFTKSYSETTTVTVFNNTDLSLRKDVNVEKDLHLKGEVDLDGVIDIDANAMAVIDDKQINTGNGVQNSDQRNDATSGDAAGQNATGNIGVNLVAGDNNQQDNAAAISAADASFVTGSADAEIFVNQDNAFNFVTNLGTQNNATLSGDSLNAASGNIGVNITAGTSNGQKNNLAMSSSVSRLSEASVATLQQTASNRVSNVQGEFNSNQYTASIGDNVLVGASGNIGVNVSAGNNNLQSNSLAIAAAQ